MRRLSRCRPLPGGVLLLLIFGLAAAGCGRADRTTAGPETEDPLYRRGLQLLKQGRNDEALGTFLKVIEKRGDQAPQSQLEAGLLYEEDFKDPIYAIYHFRKFLELEPDSRQAGLVRQRIEAAERQFASSLPGRPLQNQTSRFDLMARIRELEKENTQLRARLVRLDPAAAAKVGGGGTAGTPKPSPAPSSLDMTIPSLAGGAGAASEPAASPVRPAGTGAQGGGAPPSPERTHVVAPGETLYGIAQRYYGNGSKWPEILAANRDKLKKANEVKPGMVLRIP